MKVLFAGGGTGGHIFPAVAVIDVLRRLDPTSDTLFVLGRGGKGSAMLERAGVRWDSIPVGGMPRRNLLALIPFAARAAAAFARSVALVRNFRPAAVVAVGGYASAPIAAAAALLRIPVFAMEQNVVAGIATRWNARFAGRIFLAFDEARNSIPHGRHFTVSGNPIRSDVLASDRDRALERWGLDPERRTVLIVGGSQGARTLNKIVLEVLQRWERPRDVQFLFQTGEADFETIRDSCSRIDHLVRAVPFLADMGDAYGVADLVVCRAGASTLSELTALGLPSILVPYPWSAEQHQSANAKWLASRGAAIHFEQEELTVERLEGTMTGLLADDDRRRTMSDRARGLGKPEAAATIAEMILAAGGERGSDDHIEVVGTGEGRVWRNG